jgi:hypothetical protein
VQIKPIISLVEMAGAVLNSNNSKIDGTTLSASFSAANSGLPRVKRRSSNRLLTFRLKKTIGMYQRAHSHSTPLFKV